MTKTALEGSRGHQKTPYRGGHREAARWGRAAHHGAARSLAVAPAWQFPEASSTASYSCIYAVLQVGLIQGLTLHPQGYITRP
jgi:hypothetical protein